MRQVYIHPTGVQERRNDRKPFQWLRLWLSILLLQLPFPLMENLLLFLHFSSFERSASVVSADAPPRLLLLLVRTKKASHVPVVFPPRAKQHSSLVPTLLLSFATLVFFFNTPPFLLLSTCLFLHMSGAEERRVSSRLVRAGEKKESVSRCTRIFYDKRRNNYLENTRRNGALSRLSFS